MSYISVSNLLSPFAFGDPSIEHWRLFNAVCIFTLLIMYGDGSMFETEGCQVNASEMSDDGNFLP
jgi:hypothetical protein